MSNYIVNSEIKNFVHKANLNISSEAIIIVDGRVDELLKRAVKRARGNRRKTIMPYDILGPKSKAKYIVKTKLKDFAHNTGMNVSSEAIIIIDGRIEELLNNAIKRAKANRRKTVMPYDF